MNTLCMLLNINGLPIEWWHILLAVVPVLLLIVLLGFLKISGDKSAIITLIVTAIIAIFGFNYAPLNTGMAFIYGAMKAIFPILLIILMAMFSYNVLLHTKKMEILKQQFATISTDKCIQVLLLTWGFGGLLEGMAGFGTAVAIPAAILISLGFKPIFSAVSSLIANSVATGFGAVGTPVITLAKEVFGDNPTALQVQEISANVILQLSPLMFIIPFILVFMTDSSMKALPKNIILSLIVGLVSLITQYVSARYIGAETPAIMGSLASIVVIILFGKLASSKVTSTTDSKISKTHYSLSDVLGAWSVYGLILILIILSSPLAFRTLLASLGIVTTFNFDVAVMQLSALAPIIETKSVRINWLTDAWVMLLIASIVGGLIQGAKIGELFKLLGKTTYNLRKTIVTVVCLIGLSSIMDLSSMIAVIGVALVAVTGMAYPFFAPLIGCLGTFLTGSDTSSNILFGKLQANVSDTLAPGNEAYKSWLSAANTAGATGGKIISPQSIAVATSAGGQQGKEGEIMKKAIPYALGYILITGIMVYFLPKMMGLS